MRRRRLVLTGLVFLVMVAGVVTYVAVYDWPSLAVDGWDWLQGLAGWVPGPTRDVSSAGNMR